VLQDVSFTYQRSADTPNPDTVPPRIVSRSPAAGATAVSPALPVTLTFSELMNAATITTATVRLRAAGASSDVAATLTYTGSTATLTPSAVLNGNTTYQVTVAGTITDTSGNPLGSNATWSFTTATLILSFGDTTAADFGAGTTGANTYLGADQQR